MKTLAIPALCVAWMGLALPALAEAQREGASQIHVAAGDLDDAVEVLAKQTGVNVMYAGDVLDGRKTAGVDGTLSPNEAFGKLLEGTSLKFTDERGALRIAQASPAQRPRPATRLALADTAAHHDVDRIAVSSRHEGQSHRALLRQR